MTETNQTKRIQELKKERGVSIFLRLSFIILVIGVLWSWTAKSLHNSVIDEEQRSQNLHNFLKKIIPDPTRETGNWSEALPWLSEIIFDQKGIFAGLMTFGLATTAIWISATLAFLVLPMAARNLASNIPLGIEVSNSKMSSAFWKLVNKISRLGFLFTRSLPEYVLGFLLLSILGPDPWALVLALAIHNVGILGRLGSEIIENNKSSTPKLFIAHGRCCHQYLSQSFLRSVKSQYLSLPTQKIREAANSEEVTNFISQRGLVVTPRLKCKKM